MPNIQKILLSADTPCDIGSDLQQRYDVSLFPLHIVLGERSFTDGQDITPQDLFAAWREQKLLPRTAAINPAEYAAYFKPFVEDGYHVIHLSIGSGISSSHQNAAIAAGSFGGRVCVIDSKSLSTGFGLLVCEAGERIAQGMAFEQICRELVPLAEKTRASFVLDTLEFLNAGGRCSSLARLSADVLSLKPSILVRNDLCGSMVVGKKYIGRLDRSVLKYVEDQLKDRTDIVLDRVFITYSSLDAALLHQVEETVLRLQPFREVHITTASCTISAHCGPNCIGVLFLTK